MNKRNENFAAVLAYLKDRGDIETQKDLAELMGVSQDTISRILKGGSVSESTITKLHAATKGLFNLQWLHGQSDVMLSAEAMAARQPSPTLPDATITALIAAKDETIASLKRELTAKDETIAAKDAIIATKDKLISTLQQQIDDLRMQAALEKGLHTPGRSRLAAAERSDASAYSGK
jgi:transcriptional regulator with XRE-family HTH domain